MNFGFSLWAAPRGVDFTTYEPPRGGAAPLVTSSEAGPVFVVLVGRLHYRQDLQSGLGQPGLEERSDADLALEAFLASGPAGLERLEGDFALTVWDGRAQRIHLRRDPLGAYPLFWARAAGRIGVSTGLRPLLDAVGRRNLDFDHLAGFLAAPGRFESASERCAYEGVTRVLPQELLTFDLGTGSITRRQCWDWAGKLRDPGSDDLADIAPLYSDVLRRAVRERLSAATLCHLSGGMDSTSVCLLALDEIRSGHGAAPLHAASLVYTRFPDLAKERPYIDSVLHANPDLVGHRIPADDTLHYDAFSDPPFHDEPFLGLRDSGVERRLVEVARQAGASTVLTGHGADDVADLSLESLAELLRGLRFGSAWREACRFATARRSNAFRLLWSHGFQRRPRAVVAPWIVPSFARRYDLLGRIQENNLFGRGRVPSPGLSMALYRTEQWTGNPYQWALAAPAGIRLTQPFLDPRVIALHLGISTRFVRDYGRSKPVLAEAMRGILPEEIRNRPHKRPFNEIFYAGLSRNAAGLEALVRSAPDDGWGMFRTDMLVDAVRQATMGVGEPSALEHLNSTLALMKWLSMQSRWQSESPEPVTHTRFSGSDAKRSAGSADPRR